MKSADELFHRAAALPACEQAAFLSEECAGNSDLRHRLEKMLESDRDPHPDWQVAALEAAARHGGAEPLPDYTARIFGRYRATERLGRGGMGVVYKAVREDDEYQQTVAVKILPGGFDTPDRIERFRHERQILASLVHPHIARLLDGGTTADGLPYLVMEFIDGLPLDQYAERAASSIEARLRLFQRVADAVQFAHRNLVVHCDLKPANILVEADGTPKLLDFGIAKLLDEVRMSRTSTAPLMTPKYASPEQVAGRPITTASDVYSLGVLLVTLCEEAPSEVANIAAMATRAEPERRYASVERLSADIDRYLSHRPVVARGDSVFYRTRKYVRRNWATVALASVAAIAIATGVTVSHLQTLRAARRFDEIRGLAHFLIFDTYDGMARLQGSTPLRKSVVSKALEYLDSLARDAGDDAALSAEIADSYSRLGVVQGTPYLANLGDTRGALASMDKASALLEPLVRRYPGRTQYSAALAVSYRIKARILAREDRPDESEAAAQKAVAVLETANRSTPPTAEGWMNLAHAQAVAGVIEDWRAIRWHAVERFSVSVAWLSKAKESLQRASTNQDAGRRASLLFMTYAHLDDTERNWGDESGDVRHYEQALGYAVPQLALVRELAATNMENQRNLADSLVSMGRVLGRLKRFAEADGYYREALPYFEKAAAVDRENLEAQQDLGNLYNYRGETFARASDGAGARLWSARAVGVYESVLQHDPQNREVAQLLEESRTRLVAEPHEH